MRMRCMTVSCEETGAGDRCLKDLGLLAPHIENLDEAWKRAASRCLKVQTLVNPASRVPMQRPVEKPLEKFVLEAVIQG